MFGIFTVGDSILCIFIDKYLLLVKANIVKDKYLPDARKSLLRCCEYMWVEYQKNTHTVNG